MSLYRLNDRKAISSLPVRQPMARIIGVKQDATRTSQEPNAGNIIGGVWANVNIQGCNFRSDFPYEKRMANSFLKSG
jgi:hypothetical protein